MFISIKEEDTLSTLPILKYNTTTKQIALRKYFINLDEKNYFLRSKATIIHL
jgi:hypothetical protein